MSRKDITERLRDYAGDYTTTTYHDDLIREAATEIVQLRQQLATANSAYKIVQNDCWNLTEKVIPNLRQQLAASQQALSKVCEEWSGIDGMPQPEDEVGWYLFQLVEKMRDAAFNNAADEI